MVQRLRAIPHEPQLPQRLNRGVALIGCGGITRWHLTAYQKAGFQVVALCDLDKARAVERRDAYFPRATATDSVRDVLERDDVEIVDITTHPPERPPLIEAALRARKHVLSQKPFVLDLDEGERLCDIADECGVRLGVNQNGRWAPHFAYARNAVQSGALGDILAAHLSVHWSHAWVKGTPFERVRHLILYDYAIHWFDMLCCLMDGEPQRVFASATRTELQEIEEPLLAQAMVEYERGQATLAFDADTPQGRQERMFISGSLGTIRSTGPGNNEQNLVIDTGDEVYSPSLQGSWFPDGFIGTMGEMMCGLEEDRPLSIAARDNLRSLALCFAAVASSQTGEPVVPGSIRRLPA